MKKKTTQNARRIELAAFVAGVVVVGFLISVNVTQQYPSVKGASTSNARMATETSANDGFFSTFSQWFHRLTGWGNEPATRQTPRPRRGFIETVKDKLSGSDTESSTDELSGGPDVTKLPLGDDKYSTSAQKGYVYSCMTSFNGGGAFTQGPWINAAAGTWDLTQKAQVDGDVSWPNAQWSITSNGSTRTLTSSDLPRYHTTGTYPISSSDDAYRYDRNPHSIESQNITLQVSTNPTLLSTPECVGGEVGVMLSGVLIFNAFDAGGRDAVAMEVQDHCQGHPQQGGYYHYHGWSSCLQDETAAAEHSALVGYAFDGFGIYGLKGEGGIELSSEDLDECHGHTHAIDWDGTNKEMFHYHMTQDFPYSVGCFRGKAATKALSSGEKGGFGGMMGETGSGAGPGGNRRPPPRR